MISWNLISIYFFSINQEYYMVYILICIDLNCVQKSHKNH